MSRQGVHFHTSPGHPAMPIPGRGARKVVVDNTAMLSHSAVWFSTLLFRCIAVDPRAGRAFELGKPRQRGIPVFLDYQCHNIVIVEPKERTLYRISARVDDGLFSGEALLDVRLPALNIESASLRVTRDVLGSGKDLSGVSQRLVGVRVGPGMTQIVRAVMGGPDGSERMTDMVLEAMEMLVNALTVPELRKAVEHGGIPYQCDSDGPKVLLNDMVIGEALTRTMAANPRLKDSCAAFRDVLTEM